MHYTYNNGLQTEGWIPKLWIVHRGRVHTFLGAAIPGVVAVTSASYHEAGRWSNPYYQLELDEEAVPCNMMELLKGQEWPDIFRVAAYDRFMRESGAPLALEAFDEALLRDYPNSRTRMLECEKALEAVGPIFGEVVEFFAKTVPGGLVEVKHTPGPRGSSTTMLVFAAVPGFVVPKELLNSRNLSQSAYSRISTKMMHLLRRFFRLAMN